MKVTVYGTQQRLTKHQHSRFSADVLTQKVYNIVSSVIIFDNLVDYILISLSYVIMLYGILYCCIIYKCVGTWTRLGVATTPGPGPWCTETTDMS